jgi:hypothetical protein
MQIALTVKDVMIEKLKCVFSAKVILILLHFEANGKATWTYQNVGKNDFQNVGKNDFQLRIVMFDLRQA